MRSEVAQQASSHWIVHTCSMHHKILTVVRLCRKCCVSSGKCDANTLLQTHVPADAIHLYSSSEDKLTMWCARKNNCMEMFTMQHGFGSSQRSNQIVAYACKAGGEAMYLRQQTCRPAGQGRLQQPGTSLPHQSRPQHPTYA